MLNKISAIICEYNPLHNGHESHIRATRNMTGCDAVIAVMSGNFVQRGEAAALDKYTRAAAAIHAGADMVIELPTAAAIASADIFALTSVRLLNAIKDVTHLSFGSESGKIIDLMQLADTVLSEPPEVSELISKRLSTGESFAAARARAYTQVLGDAAGNLLSSPNNVLGIEYIKALKVTSSAIKPVTIKRVGAGYHDPDYNAHTPSATGIREALRTNRLSVLDKAVPEFAAQLYMQAFDHTKYINVEHKLYDLLRYRIHCAGTPLSLSNIADIAEGLEYRIFAARNEPDYTSFLAAVKSKRYTMARIKRIILNILLGITTDTAAAIRTAPPYYNILAIKKDRKSDLLSLLPDNRITRRGDYDLITHSGTAALVDLNVFADEVFSIITETPPCRFFGTGMLTL